MTLSVPIVSFGAVTALGPTAAATFDALCEGRSAIGPIREFDASGFPCSVAARMEPFDPEALGLAPRDARTMRHGSYALLVAAREAFEQAGLDGEVPRERIGFFAGMGTVDYRVEDLLGALKPCLRDDGSIDYAEFFGVAYREIHPLWPLQMLNNVGHSQVAIQLDLRGDNATYSPHGESGAQAVREATDAVARGTVDAALAGGAGDEVLPECLARHTRLGWLSASGELKPFAGDGGVLGEAAGCLILESEASLRRRGRPALGRLRGWSMRCAARETADAYATAVAGSMRAALLEAHVEAEEVTAVFANGDGRPPADAGEAEAIRGVLGGDTPVTSTKPALGVTLAAAGVLDVGLALMALRRGTVPPCSSGGEELPIHLVRGEPLTIEGDVAIVNVQGLNGQCASMVVQAAKE